jgi:hypothetical protein
MPQTKGEVMSRVERGGRKRLTKTKKQYQAMVRSHRVVGEENEFTGKWYPATKLRCVASPLRPPRGKGGKVNGHGGVRRAKFHYCCVAGCQTVTGGAICKRHEKYGSFEWKDPTVKSIKKHLYAAMLYADQVSRRT